MAFYLVSLGDLTDDLAGGGVDGGEGFPVDGVVPFIIDEELKKKKKKMGHIRASGVQRKIHLCRVVYDPQNCSEPKRDYSFAISQVGLLHFVF